MNVHFLYPCDFFDNKKVEEQYREEYDAAKSHGLNVHVFNQDDILGSSVKPALDLSDKNLQIVYRGWMLNEQQYGELAQRFGNALLTPLSAYLKAHHLPGWYDLLESWTIPSVITTSEQAVEVMKDLNKPMFIKDYVKSLKTGKGSIVENAEDVKRALEDMLFYRNQIEGGIVLREKVDLMAETEKRFFIIHHQVYGLDQATDEQWNLALQINEVLKNQAADLSFVSLDIALLANGKPVAIEMGDGQVSDYTGWQVQEFVENLANLENLTHQNKKGKKL
jgi:hypothetical protein